MSDVISRTSGTRKQIIFEEQIAGLRLSFLSRRLLQRFVLYGKILR